MNIGCTHLSEKPKPNYKERGNASLSDNLKYLNTIVGVGSLRFRWGSAQKQKSGTPFSESTDVTYFYLGSSSYRYYSVTGEQVHVKP